MSDCNGETSNPEYGGIVQCLTDTKTCNRREIRHEDINCKTFIYNCGILHNQTDCQPFNMPGHLVNEKNFKRLEMKIIFFKKYTYLYVFQDNATVCYCQGDLCDPRDPRDSGADNVIPLSFVALVITLLTHYLALMQ